MKVNCSLEPLFVSESSGIALDFLDHRVEALGSGVGRAGHYSGQNAL